MALYNHEGKLISTLKAGENVYEHDYYAGSQVLVMIGDILIDDALDVRFNVSQSKTPVYSWANQYYSFIADGYVLVQGELIIAFKETGYLFSALREFAEKARAGESTSPRVRIDPNSGIMISYSGEEYTSFQEYAKAAARRETIRGNVEQLMEWKRSGSFTYNKMYHDLYHDLGRLKDDEFEQWAETFEDAIWYGSDTANPLSRDRLNSNNIRADESLSDETVLSHRRADQYPPVDIWVTYGDMSRSSVNHTVKKIMDVSFTGQSQSINSSEGPVVEVYSFIARNLV